MKFETEIEIPRIWSIICINTTSLVSCYPVFLVEWDKKEVYKLCPGTLAQIDSVIDALYTVVPDVPAGFTCYSLTVPYLNSNSEDVTPRYDNALQLMYNTQFIIR